MSNTTRRRCSSRTARVRSLVVLIAATGATLGAIACSSSSSTAPNAGSLTVAITAPAGVTPNVTVSGPGGYSKALSATITLTALAAGSYTVTAAPATTTAPIVGTVNTAMVSGSPATVTAGSTAAIVTANYAVRPGSGGLWVANILTGTVVEYAAGQLGSTTSALPATAIATGTAGYGIAFDASGNLWVANFSAGTVVEYMASELSASGTPMPALTLSEGASMSGPVAVAFDASGNLWVANGIDSTVVEFTVSQLGSSGNPAPAVTLSASGGSLKGPAGLAFDANGNLWVANAGNSTVVEFAPSQLVATGSPTPAITLSPVARSMAGPQLIAFDAHGNLWVANGADPTVVAFSPSQLTTTGSPTPTVTLSATAGTGLAFDASGNLWVANAGGNSVVEFTASQLVASSSPTPKVIISGSSLSAPFGLAFDPHGAGLPLKP